MNDEVYSYVWSNWWTMPRSSSNYGFFSLTKSEIYRGTPPMVPGRGVTDIICFPCVPGTFQQAVREAGDRGIFCLKHFFEELNIDRLSLFTVKILISQLKMTLCLVFQGHSSRVDHSTILSTCTLEQRTKKSSGMEGVKNNILQRRRAGNKYLSTFSGGKQISRWNSPTLNDPTTLKWSHVNGPTLKCSVPRWNVPSHVEMFRHTLKLYVPR